ncbi:hypothetical protein PKNOH_S140254400 [Plasmodium knowlesi]|uniref:Uncharacterized protein n=1 Tax=Plasmodium knowlesi TaxID=5850 RepID=A0A1Y3DLG4_PLAKN|nr:hypothetical protein PKNOH_S140254400 [Plasmodium knowlesi]
MATPGIEPGTSCTRSKNHTTRSSSLTSQNVQKQARYNKKDCYKISKVTKLKLKYFFFAYKLCTSGGVKQRNLHVSVYLYDKIMTDSKEYLYITFPSSNI